MYRRTAGIAAALSALAAAAPASAAPFTLAAPRVGTHLLQHPSVVVDGAGTAHVAWNEQRVHEPDQTHYCRIPAGGSGCAPGSERSFIPTLAGGPGHGEFGGPWVVEGPDGPIVLTNRCCVTGSGLFSYVSTDGGATFNSGMRVGTVAPGGDAVASVRGALVTSDAETNGLHVQAVDPNGPATAEDANLTDPSNLDQRYNGTVAESSTLRFAAFDDGSGVFVRASNLVTNPNDVGSWWAAQFVAQGTDPRLAARDMRVMLTYRTPDARIMASEGDTGGWIEPVAISGPAADGADVSVARDGTVAAAWTEYGGDVPRVIVRSTGEERDSWGKRRLLAEMENVMGLEIAADKDGTGFAVWAAGGTIYGEALERAAEETTAGPAPAQLRGEEPVVTVPARIDRFAISRRRFRVGPGRTPRIARARRGTRFEHTVTVAGPARFAIARLRKGRKAKRVGTLRRTLAAGAGSTAFSGRIGSKRLRPGRYRATLTLVDAAGHARAASERLRFRVARR